MTDISPWTPNQQTLIVDKFEYHPTRNPNPPDYLEFEVRASNAELDKAGSHLRQGDKVRIYRGDVYKSIGNGDGNTIVNTIQMFP